MANGIGSRSPAPAIAEDDLDAFFRHRPLAPVAACAALISSLDRLDGSDDPRVTFGRLPESCVPWFADGCEVELSDGAEPPLRVVRPGSSADHPGSLAAPSVGPDQVLVTPFRAVSLIGYPSYAGVVTYSWTDRNPSESEAVIADLMVKHLVAVVERERLMAAVARAEDRAANLALQAISGRTISLATGIVMHQNRLGADDAEVLLRQSAGTAGRDLQQVASDVVRSGSLPASPAAGNGVGRCGPPRPAR
jgi:ANTAR domain